MVQEKNRAIMEDYFVNKIGLDPVLTRDAMQQK